MSTRATYQIATGTGKPVTFYIHHDGYPDGAAQYFLSACRHTAGKGGLAEKFIQANHQASFTDGHAGHTDTEYRYTVNASHNLLVERRTIIGGDKWVAGFRGSLADFIAENTGVTLICFRGEYMDCEAAHRQALTLQGKLKQAIDKKWNGNAHSYANDAWHLRNLIAKAFGEEKSVGILDAAIDAADRILCKSWEAHYGDQAYAQWRKEFRSQN